MDYTTQMDAARKQIYTEEMKEVAKKENMDIGELCRLVAEGKAIIMISSEMSELIGMSDRVMVMCDGRVTGFIDGSEANQENIMALATQFE